jgi:magnesium-transporting ATPase (P-type)
LYQGQSPDEITLLDAAKEVGYIFTEKTQATITVEIAGHNYIFDLLHKIEFSSERQMMSVIVKDPTSGCIILFAKGADAKIMSEKYMC